MARQSKTRRPPEPLIYAPLLSLDQDAMRALGKRGNGSLKALSTGDDSALEGLSYLEDLDVVDAEDAVDVVEGIKEPVIAILAPLPFQRPGTVQDLSDQKHDENTSIRVNTQTGIQENKFTSIQEYPQTSLRETIETGISVSTQADNQSDYLASNQENKFTGNIAVWPDAPVRGRRGSLQPLPGKIHWERRSNRTYRIDAETHDLVGDAATLVQRQAGYKLTRDDIAEWALRYAARDILSRGMMSDILRDLLSPNDTDSDFGLYGGDDAVPLQSDGPGDYPTDIRENKNTVTPS